MKNFGIEERNCDTEQQRALEGGGTEVLSQKILRATHSTSHALALSDLIVGNE
jgi:hypothetical protein